jgi:hypothetical protein
MKKKKFEKKKKNDGKKIENWGSALLFTWIMKQYEKSPFFWLLYIYIYHNHNWRLLHRNNKSVDC